jgi:hypothetical protein
MHNTLDDVRTRQLTKIRGDIVTAQNGVNHLEESCMEVLDEVNIRVDGLVHQIKELPPPTPKAPPLFPVDSSGTVVVPTVSVPEGGPPDGAPRGSPGLMPSHRPSESGYAPATGQPHSIFSSSAASHGDRAQGDRHNSRMLSPWLWGHGHGTFLPHNPYKGETNT